jgi:hypothetical protein
MTQDLTQEQRHKHQKQTDDAVVRSLNAVGIRARYHRTTLAQSNHPEAKRLGEWVMTGSAQDAESGWTFIGDNDVEDLAILVARGLHITGRKCQVMPLIRFYEWLDEDRSYLEDRLADATALLVTQAGPSEPGDIVFSKRELRRIETRLDEWMAGRQRLLLHATLPVTGAGWFSTGFLQRVARRNETIGAWK